MVSVAIKASLQPELWLSLFQEHIHNRDTLISAVGHVLGYPLMDTLPKPPQSVSSLLSASVARRYGVVPLLWEDHRLQVAAINPFIPDLAEDLSTILASPVILRIADPNQVDAMIQMVYRQFQGSGTVEEEDKSAYRLSSSVDYATDAPVIALVDQWLMEAISDGASDIHFEPFLDCYRVRFRVDGNLRELPEFPKALAMPVTSRLKVLAELDIAECRLPQDGRIRKLMDGRSVDLRVSTLPTQFGESVVLRVLDQTLDHLRLTKLGMPVDVLAGVRKVAAYPHGIFIATGPTGSGKTTTLYSALREVNSEEIKILTAEDPVEYEVSGLVQTVIRPSLGLNFASALRSFLRHDPDVILVGEIRDEDTARVAVEASMTGHMVFSSLHTNDAVGAVARLMDLGVETYLIAATLSAVLAQRLVRKLCPHCRLSLSGVFPFKENPVGCKACRFTGYHGRTGIFEWLLMNESFREAIITGAGVSDLLDRAQQNGMRTLRSEGLGLAKDGVISQSEVLRHTD